MSTPLILELILAALQHSPRLFDLIDQLARDGELTPQQAAEYKRRFQSRMDMDHWKTDEELSA